jgi:hypothetical protein
MASPEDQREALAKFAEAVGRQGHHVVEALAYIGSKLLAVQEDHAATREELYALTQRVAELERRERVADRRQHRG